MSGIDFEKLKEVKEQLDKEIHQELMEDLTKDIINFVLDKDIAYNLKTDKSRKNTTQTKRMLSYWVKKGVIKPAQREKDGAWFYFDRIESIWVDILTQLREFGLDADKLLKIRESLFREEVKNFRMIDFCITHSVLKEPYMMVIYADGEVGFMSVNKYVDLITQIPTPPHVVLNFLHLAQEIFPNNNFNLELKVVQNANLNPAEMKILYFLRTGDFEEIKVRLKDGETLLIEASRKVNVKDRVIDVIKQADYQNIEIKTENGQIVSFKATEKIKI